MNRKDWLTTAHLVICIDHFVEKFIKGIKKCQLLCCGNCIQYLQFIMTQNPIRDFIFQTFSVIDFISPTIKIISKNVYVRSFSEKVFINSRYGTNFTCNLHKKWGEKLAARTVVSIFSITNKKMQMIWLEKNK